MEINTRTEQEVSILKLKGELDASNAVIIDHELQRLITKNPKHIWVDGSGISYISSAGLGVFLSHLSTLQQKNIRLVFFGLNDKIKNIFTILGLEEIIPIVKDLQAAQEISRVEFIAE